MNTSRAERTLRKLQARSLDLPSLDLIAKDPASAGSLEQAEIATLLAQTAAVQSVLTAKLIAMRVDSALESLPSDEEMITVEQASRILHRSRRWIWRHKKSLPFVRQISGKSLLCSKSGVQNWLASRRIDEVDHAATGQ